MINISTEVLSSLLGKTAAEIESALNDSKDDQSKIDDVISKMFEDKIKNVRSTSTKEGRGWGKKEALSDKQKEIATTYEVDENGEIDDVIQRIIEAKTTATKLTAADVRNSEFYKNDIAGIKSQNESLVKEKESLNQKLENQEIDLALKEIETAALKGKAVVSEFAKKNFRDNLKANAKWLKIDGKYQPCDEDGFPLKDKAFNQLSPDQYAKNIADQLFSDEKPGKTTIPNVRTDETGSDDSFQTEFENDEDQMKYFEALKPEQKAKYAQLLEEKLLAES